MSLTDIWLKSRNQLEEKHIQQIISFSGDGQLKDGSKASDEFRSFLSNVPSIFLRRYADQCLQNSFNNSGLVLQDIINQVGRRLGFKVTDGRYRGTVGQIGYDGIWDFPLEHSVIVEVKTTDAYRIDLDTIAQYRRTLIDNGTISKENSSILIIVGRGDTGDLEAQIRGSRHAWDVRLISIDALMRLLALKEAVEDPKIINRIHAILIPREFTKLDEIIEVVFSTAEDVKQEEVEKVDVQDKLTTKTDTPVSFHEACIDRIQKHLKCSLVKRSRASFSSADGSLALICAISKTYDKDTRMVFWFAFHPHQREFLEHAKQGFVAFGCGSVETLLLIPAPEFLPWLDGMNITELENKKYYWHVHIFYENGKFSLYRKKGAKQFDLTKFLIPGESSAKRPNK